MKIFFTNQFREKSLMKAKASFYAEKSNSKIIYSANRILNYYARNIFYYVNFNDNNSRNKFIYNGCGDSNGIRIIRKNSNFNYSMSKTNREVYLDK